MATEEELQAEIERLRAENQSLKKPPARGQISMRVSEKGALSVYGLGRSDPLRGSGKAPTSPTIRAFIRDNDEALKRRITNQRSGVAVGLTQRAPHVGPAHSLIGGCDTTVVAALLKQSCDRFLKVGKIRSGGARRQ
jgi:hypothetical protein